MNWRREWLQPPYFRAKSCEQVDMGNGRSLNAEDFLEGHFSRMAVSTNPDRTRHVSVQVEGDLRAAIAVLAPGLAPLAEVAEEVAMIVPNVRPGLEFRRKLHRALEQTHRQHAAQKALGTRSVESSKSMPVSNRISAGLGVFLVVAGLLALLLLRRRPRAQLIGSA
ncbi:MAG: hypothetical protein HC802_01545 [Caldilineaceae bacterium]|nr:hypothetical protein [Caldilineaceae bacterium]